MKTAEIARRYLSYFEKQDHVIVPSASLVSDDPALMFTIAGMVPFIPYLSGDVPAPYKRAADNQKCIRTLDIEEVGKTPRHGTFFQMMGNWSFGDYFKRDAIRFAWELLTGPESDGGLGFDPKDLWVTVYEEDDEAFDLWLELSSLPADRIQRLGKDTNYWTTGLPGPAGPCSEIFFDMGPEYGPDGGPATDHDRYVEIWNLVFMQYEITDVRSKTEFTIVGDLPAKNVDTGFGLERVAFIKQGVQNMYEIDEVRPVLDVAVELSGKRYGDDHDDDVRFRVVADHVRSSLMLLSDGVTPSNEGRGYVLRRLMRRAIRAMRLLGVEGPTFARLFAASRDAMKETYPELERDYARLEGYALGEEATFLRTLSAGSEILDTAVRDAKAAGQSSLGGDRAFLLHDTYGFPIDLTLEVAEEAGLQVDRASFDALMREQRERAKADSRARKGRLADTSVYRDLRAQGETTFTGFTDLETSTSVLGILVDGIPTTHASHGQIAEVVLAETALYAESGGQVADKGIIVGPGYELDVIDVQRPVPGLISHTVEVTSGEVGVGQPATTIVDAANRRAAEQAHSATHLVHAALRDTLGPGATQAGSLNRAGYLRFDFAWNQALSDATKSEVEEIANNAIRDNLEVTTRVLPLAEAKELGAMALFGEKYGDTVRMVDIGGPWSRELCGGTHVDTSSQVGLISLVGESSVGAANRRVEALVGADAFRELAAERSIVSQLSSTLKAPRDELPARIADLSANLRAAEKKIAQLQLQALDGQVPRLVEGAQQHGELRVVAESLGVVPNGDDVRQIALRVRDRLGAAPAVVALAGEAKGRAVVIVATNDAARDRGITAGPLAKEASAILGGGGGGRDDVAQGGGTDVSSIAAALTSVAGTVERSLL